MSDCVQVVDFLSFETHVLEDASLYEAIFRESIDGILVADDHARYVDVNEAACEMLGRRREEIVGNVVGCFLEHASDAHKFWEKARRTGSMRAEIMVVRPGGERRKIELVGVADVRPGRHMLVIRDLTFQKNFDELNRNASTIEAVGRLAGSIAHDFNNLLMVISSYTEMMLDETGVTDPLRKRAEEVLKAASRAAELTRQLVDFSREWRRAGVRQDAL